MMHNFFAVAFARDCYATWIYCASQKVAIPLMNWCFHTLNDKHIDTHMRASDNPNLYRGMVKRCSHRIASIVCI